MAKATAVRRERATLRLAHRVRQWGGRGAGQGGGRPDEWGAGDDERAGYGGQGRDGPVNEDASGQDPYSDNDGEDGARGWRAGQHVDEGTTAHDADGQALDPAGTTDSLAESEAEPSAAAPTSLSSVNTSAVSDAARTTTAAASVDSTTCSEGGAGSDCQTPASQVSDAQMAVKQSKVPSATATRTPVSAQTATGAASSVSSPAAVAQQLEQQPGSSGQKAPTEGKAATHAASGPDTAINASASSLPSPSSASFDSQAPAAGGSTAGNAQAQTTSATSTSSAIGPSDSSAMIVDATVGQIAQSAGAEQSALPSPTDLTASSVPTGVDEDTSVASAVSNALPSEINDTNAPKPSVAEYWPPVGGRPFDYIPAPGDTALALGATASDTPQVQINEKVVIGTSCGALLLAVCVTAVLCRYRKRFHRQSGQTVRDWIHGQSSQASCNEKEDGRVSGQDHPNVNFSALLVLQSGLARVWRKVRREPAIALPPDTGRPTTIESFTNSPVVLGESRKPSTAPPAQAKKRFFLPVLSSPLYTPSPTAIGSPGRPLLLGARPNSPASPLTPLTPAASRMRPRSRPILRSSWSAVHEGAHSPSSPLSTTPARLFSPVTPAIHLHSPPPAVQRSQTFKNAVHIPVAVAPSAHLLQAPKPALSSRQSDSSGGETQSVYSGVSEGLGHYPFVLEKN